MPKKEKDRKGKYGKNRYHNASKENKQKLKEYQRAYCKAKKST